jgi:hypothetical protein
LGGYFGSLALLAFAFSMSIAAIFGAPDPARQNKRKEGVDENSDEEEEGEFESEAGMLLTQWMAGGSGYVKGMPKRSVRASADEGIYVKPAWLPPVAASSFRCAVEKPQTTPIIHSSKISKLTKID